MGDKRGAYRILMGRPGGKRLLGRPRNRWDYNIKMDLQEGDRETWTGLLWLRIGPGCGREPRRAQISSASQRKPEVTHMAVSCECGHEPLGSITCGEFLD